jgi:hypothetical protein
MPVLKVMKKFTKASFARLSPWAKGRIIGMRQEGAKREDIALEVQRKDGSSPSLCTVDAVVARFEKDPEWDGCEERTAGGPSASKHLTPWSKMLVRPSPITQSLCLIMLVYGREPASDC